MTVERIGRRVVVSIKRSSNYGEIAWENPTETIDTVLESLKGQGWVPSETKNEQPDVRLIISKITSQETLILFDLFHDGYDFETAHLYGQDLPVLLVAMGRRGHKGTHPADALMTRKVNFEVRYLYNRNGWKPPPFSEDARTGSAWAVLQKDFRDHEATRRQRQDEIAARKDTQNRPG
ncbi:hypothetical protein CGGC5_v017008 [Colletotrichum fructicola Nara gc5]|uniref:Uncharacterized protein n=1 Tax=Colletotrichum fructicola (strain Nara gc5) TaxID=1213859 RepID=A0A7J6IDJ9_COLFN|nr:hypothetical protein CFRS1_v015154 [Colletotrichum fructicola]KAF4473894.1 hypothetical protein CGGC5_v017008 [Colletotrichum fructicola Nara gc5]